MQAKKTSQNSYARLVKVKSMWSIWFLLIVIFIVMLYFNPYNKNIENMILGMTVIVLSLWPLQNWLTNKRERNIPLLACHGLFYAICFGFAGFVGQPLVNEGLLVTENQQLTALYATVLSWVALLIGYKAISIGFKSNKLDLFSKYASADRYKSALIFYFLILFFTVFTKKEVNITGLNSVRIFLLIWILRSISLKKKLNLKNKLLLILVVCSDLVFFGGFGEGFLMGIISYAEIFIIIYVMSKEKIPKMLIGMVVLLIPIIIGLQSAKDEYRKLTWEGGASDVGLQDSFKYLTLAGDVIFSFRDSEDIKNAFDLAYVRLNHLNTTAAILRDTPMISDFQYGETFIPLLTKWIPRAVWNEKPIEDLGNRWARKYNYLESEDYVTSFNLPWLPEMYINFGWFGIISISMILGGIIGFINNLINSNISHPANYAFGLAISQNFFFPESNISGMLGGIMVAVFCIIIFMQILLLLTKQKKSLHNNVV